MNRFYASIAYNGSGLGRLPSASESEFTINRYSIIVVWTMKTGTGRMSTGRVTLKFYNSEDSRTEGGYLVDKTEMTVVMVKFFWFMQALNELTSGQVYHLTTYTGWCRDSAQCRWNTLCYQISVAIAGYLWLFRRLIILERFPCEIERHEFRVIGWE